MRLLTRPPEIAAPFPSRPCRRFSAMPARSSCGAPTSSGRPISYPATFCRPAWQRSIRPYARPSNRWGWSLLWNQKSSTSLNWPSCWVEQSHPFEVRAKLGRTGCRHSSSKEVVSAGGSQPCASSCGSARKVGTSQSGLVGSARRRRPCPGSASRACQPTHQGIDGYSA